jgi:hypothetical protein
MIISHSHARANASPLATGKDDGALRRPDIAARCAYHFSIPRA